jgi:hypothetical protein
MTNSTHVSCRSGKSLGRAPFGIFVTAASALKGLVQFFTSSQRDKEVSLFALKEREMV